MTKARRENAYWLKYVAEATTHPDRLDRSRNAIAEVEAATPADLQGLARRYLRDDQALVLEAVSDKAGKEGHYTSPGARASRKLPSQKNNISRAAPPSISPVTQSQTPPLPAPPPPT